MSAAMSSTDGSPRRDFMTETAAGPPAPVTRTRTRGCGPSWCDTVHLRNGIRMRAGRWLRVGAVARGGHRCPAVNAGRLAGHRRIADHLECLRVPPAAEP